MKYAKTPTIYQMESTECGAASLAMIFAYYGRREPLEKMRIEAGVSRDGCNAKNLLRAARKYGLRAAGFRKELEALDEMPVPCIIHWNFCHFVVLEGKKGKYYYLNDPAQGRRKITLEEMDAGFTGIVLTFAPTEQFEKVKEKNQFWPAVARRLKGQGAALCALLLFGVCLTLPGMAIPVFSQVFIDEVMVAGREDWITALIYMMAGTVAIQMFLTFYRGIVLQRLQTKLSLLSAHSFLSHMFRLPIVFFDQRYAGDLSSRVDNNNNVSDFLAGELAETLLNLLVAVFYLALMLMYSLPLTLMGVMTVILSLIVMQLCGKAISRNSEKLQQDNGKMVGTLFAGISISPTLKASGAEGVYANRLLGYYAKTTEIDQRLGKIQKIVSAIPESLDKLSDILVLMVGGMLVIQGKMTVGMLVAFSALLSGFTDPVNKLAGFIQKIQTVKADMGRVDDIMRYEQDEKFNANPVFDEISKIKLAGSVKLQGVSFGYSRLDPPLLHDFTFELKPGSSVALVGASGSGKSTVSKLVSGLYLAWDGQILFDGKPLNEIPKEVLASSVSTISQEITIFSGTIRDNLTMWNRRISDIDIVRAAKDACIHDMITQKNGAYECALAEGGTNLSGGQRQRLEIARALATNPTILIMDEATSALDPLVEKQIIDNIKRRGCTCVIVAHRLSTIRDCDEIIVMEQGEIIQRGTHETLLAQPGHYQQLVANL